MNKSWSNHRILCKRKHMNQHVSIWEMKSVSGSVMSDSLRPQGLQLSRLPCPWDFPGKNTGVGCYFLLQGVFPTQGQNPGLLHCRQIPYCLSHQGSPSKRRPLQFYVTEVEYLRNMDSSFLQKIVSLIAIRRSKKSKYANIH